MRLSKISMKVKKRNQKKILKIANLFPFSKRLLISLN